jgi:hypothetical protein
MTTTTLFAVENIAMFDRETQTYTKLKPQFVAVTYDPDTDVSYADAKKAATTKGKRKAWGLASPKQRKPVYSHGVTTYPLAHFDGPQHITHGMALHLQKHNLNTYAVLRNAELLQDTRYHYEIATKTTTSTASKNNNADIEVTSTTTIIPIDTTVTDTSTFPANDTPITTITL